MPWLSTLLSVTLVSLISLIGVLYLFFKKKTLEHVLMYMVAFSVGALFGEVFLHILPELSAGPGLTAVIGAWFLVGLLLFFAIEKFVHWHHCHRSEHKHGGVKPLAYTNLLGDSFHNFLDGMIIAGSFLVSVPIGIATTVAVIFHEIPQEIGDFGVLLYSGFSKGRALLFNLLSGLTAVLGAVLVLSLSGRIAGLDVVLLAVAGGGFIYIAGSDLVPELHKGECTWCHAIYQFLAIVAGVAVMGGLLLVG